MVKHDQLFKDLLRVFFADLVHLAAPEYAKHLDVEHPTFEPTENFTRRPGGSRRSVDLLATVAPRDPDAGAVVSPWGSEGRIGLHIEAEGENRHTLDRRILEYNTVLRAALGRVVATIVLLRKGGTTSIEPRTIVERIGTVEVTRLTYFAFSLSQSDAAQYLDRDEPLAWALAALMRRGKWSRARHKLECLRRLATHDLNEEQQLLLANCIETYLQLNEGETMELATMLQKDTDRDLIEESRRTWTGKLGQVYDDGKAEGYDEGKAEGKAEGRAEGKAEGALQALRQTLLDLLEARFGPLAEAVASQVEQIENEHHLRRLIRDVLTAESLADLRLGES